jgi:hypothetical protein
MSGIKRPTRGDSEARPGLGMTRDASKPPQAVTNVSGARDTQNPGQERDSQARASEQVRMVLIRRSDGTQEAIRFADLEEARGNDSDIEILVPDYKKLDIIA